MHHNYQAKLEELYQELGIGWSQFKQQKESACVSCDKLIAGKLLKGADTYIGSKYGTPHRILIISLDPGKDSKSFEQRRDQIEGSKPDNLHMKGTQATLEALLINANIAKEALFSHFAMINSCKCFPDDGSMNSAPAAFFLNCRSHINREIKILEPDVIITQGKEAIDTIATYMPKSNRKTIYRQITSDMRRNFPTYFPDSYFNYLIEKYFRFVEIDGRIVPTLCPPHPSDKGGRWHFFKAAYLEISMEIVRRALTDINGR